jgi:hypothetical protein
MGGRSTSRVLLGPVTLYFFCDIRGQCCIPDAFLSHNPDFQPRPIARRCDPSLARPVAVELTRAQPATERPVRPWGIPETASLIVRASVLPAMLKQPTWAQELRHIVVSFLRSLIPMSAGAALDRCLNTKLDGSSRYFGPIGNRGTAPQRRPYARPRGR